MNDTDALPFVVVHGSWLWLVVLALFAALTMATLWAIRRVRQNLRWKTELERFARGRGSATATGVLRAPGGERAQSLHAEATEAHPDITTDYRGEALHIETEDGRKIELTGDVRVIGGSHAAACYGGVPDALGDAAMQKALVTAPWLHRRQFGESAVRVARVLSLGAGDTVRAYGVLERAPGGDESDFRSAGIAWSLRGDDGPILLVAIRPAVPRTRISRVAAGLVVAAISFAGYQIEQKLAASWRRECGDLSTLLLDAEDREVIGDRPFVAGNSHVCALATVTPKDREGALDTFLDVLEDHPYRDEAALRRMNQLTHLVGDGCQQVIRRLMELGRYEDARREAARCADRRAEHTALVALARYEEAAALPVAAQGDGQNDDERALPEVETLLAAGKWNEAAPRIAARAQEIGAQQPDETTTAGGIGLTAMHYQCLAELVRHHGGDPGAAARIRQLRAERYGISCEPMRFELEGARDGKSPGFEIEGDEPRLFETSSLMRVHAYALGGQDQWHKMAPFDGPEELLAHPTEAAILPHWELWMFNGELGELPAERRSMLLRWRAAHRVLLGDIEGARAMAKEAIALAPPQEDDFLPYDMRNLRHLLPTIALYTPDTRIGADLSEPPGDAKDLSPRRTWLHHFGRLLLRDGQPIDGAYFGPDDDLPGLLAQAQQGDGRPLARYMSGGRYRTRWWSMADLTAVLPRITLGREQVTRQVLWSRPMNYYHLNSVTAVTLNAFAKREMLRAAGLTEHAAAWDAIVRRADSVLGDRKRMMALQLYKL